MLGLICKRSLLFISNGERVLLKSNASLEFRPFYATKSCSAIVRDETEHSFAVNYLVNSCLLTLKDAKSVSKRINFKSSERADSVLCLLKSHGLTSEQISRVIRYHPDFLTYDSQETLLPKLQFLLSKEVSSSDVAMLVARNPTILRMSLEKRLIPCYDFLKSILLSDQRVFTSLKRIHRTGFFNLENCLVPNVSLMRGTGLPESYIAKLIYCSPDLFCQKTEKLDDHIKKVINMGFNSSKGIFVGALMATFQASELTWERKMKLFESWGWSHVEIWAALKKMPRLMNFSDTKISNTMDFFVNKMGLTSSAISKIPRVLDYSLEKRIVPRCLVVKILVLKGLMGKEDFAISTILTIRGKQFLDKFVIKYQRKVPQLMSIFQGKVGILELGFQYG